MGYFDRETAVRATGDGSFAAYVSGAWSIGTNPNGGYAVQPVLRAMAELTGRPDPASLTVHYLRPAIGDAEGEVRVAVVRAGRRATYASGVLLQEGVERLTVAAVLTDLTDAASDAPDPGLQVPAPAIPPPTACRDRRELDQGVELPLLSRVEVRVSRDGTAGAVVDGWIRFVDDAPPCAPGLVLFADAFPPAVHAVVEQVGWVPTLELTVHVRRRPAPGWVQARLECDDVTGGWMIETGTLWDETGAVVARSRQLGMILPHP
jgi:acyl-CoA thioesterase